MSMKEWDIPAMATALRAGTEVAYHPSDGKGVRFLVGISHTKLDVWPHTGRVSILTPSLEFSAYRMHVSAIEEELAYVAFSGGRKGAYRHFWVEANGTLLFHMPGSEDRSYLTPPARLTTRTKNPLR